MSNGPAATIRIRTARPADARVLAALRYEFRRAYANPSEREREAAFVRRCAAWMRRALGDRRRWRCWIALRGNVIVGHVWLQLIEKVPNPGAEAERHGYVTNLYVQPAARGGTGQRLLASAMDWCRGRGLDSVILWPTGESRSLYLRNGFSVSGDVLDARLTGSPLAALAQDAGAGADSGSGGSGDHLNESFRMRARRRPARMARSSATRRARAR